MFSVTLALVLPFALYTLKSVCVHSGTSHLWDAFQCIVNEILPYGTYTLHVVVISALYCSSSLT